jgi:hypothetical protein
MTNYSIEEHMREMGIIPMSFMGDLEAASTLREVLVEQGYYSNSRQSFIDPRDENGEMPY